MISAVGIEPYFPGVLCTYLSILIFKIEAAASSQATQRIEDEVRGPHAALAVRLQKRSPDRKFILGERIQYVLLSGTNTVPFVLSTNTGQSLANRKEKNALTAKLQNSHNEFK